MDELLAYDEYVARGLPIPQTVVAREFIPRTQVDQYYIRRSGSTTWEHVVSATMDFEGGCDEGKIQFLEELGVPSEYMPNNEWEVTVPATLTFTIEQYREPDSDDIHDHIRNYVDAGEAEYDVYAADVNAA